MARRAIRENWPAPAAVRAAVMSDIYDAVLLDDDAPIRLLLAAVGTIIDAEAVNQRIDLAEMRERRAMELQPWNTGASRTPD